MSEVEKGELVTPEPLSTPQTDDRKYQRLGLIIVALLVGVLGVWGSLAPLSSAVPALGKVSVASKNRLVQHLEGGIVEAINVKDGDKVNKGDVLIELDATQAKSQLQIIAAQYYENLGLESRLLAEREGRSTVSFNAEMNDLELLARNKIMDAQRREFNARSQQMIDDERVLSERLYQLENQIKGAEAIISTKTALSESYEDEIKELESLYKEQLIDKIRLRDAKREKVRTDGDIANTKAEIARNKAQINEIKAQITAQKQNFIKEVVAELSDVQAQLADNRARLSSLKDIVARTKITAPVDGIVTNLQLHTIGGVAPSGQPILEIVPEGEPLIIDAKVVATDITNVHVGLQAEIRFPGFAHIKSLNVVMGEVIHVAPDAVLDENTGSLDYPVKIKVTPEGEEELRKNHLAIQPGNPADVMIIIKSRTFMDYLIQPFKVMLDNAFNEQ